MLPVKAKSMRYVFLLLVLTWSLSACSGQSAAAVTPTSIPATPTQAPPQPTVAPTATNTVVPSPTPVPTAAPKVEPTKQAEVSKQSSTDLDARTLPQFSDAKVVYEDKAMLIYVTPADVPTVVDFSRHELTSLGWKEVVPANTSQENDPNLENMTFLKDGQELSVFITVAPAQDNKTSVQYSFPTLTTQMQEPPTVEPPATEEPTTVAVEPTAEASSQMPDVPVPSDAQDVNFDTTSNQITFTSASGIKKLVQFYRQELKKKDWVEDEILAMVEDAIGSLQFTKGEASLSFTFFRVTDDTEVSISLSGLSTPTDTSGGQVTGIETPTEEAKPTKLVAEDKDGLPVPSGYGNFSSEGTDYRRIVTTDISAPVKAVAEFYNRELAAKQWQALPSTVGPTDTEATMMFEKSAEEAQLEVQLTKNTNNGTDITLTFKSIGAAKKAGILPPSGQARIYFGNINEGPVTFSINQKEIKVAPQDPGQKSMEGVPNMDLPPGEYEYTLTISGQPPVKDKVQVGADETWGLIGGPGGAFPVQLY